MVEPNYEKDCEFHNECHNEWGEEHSTIKRSHFCRYSWKNCNCKCIQEQLKQKTKKFFVI